jgi:hypothetical protein
LLGLTLELFIGGTIHNSSLADLIPVRYNEILAEVVHLMNMFVSLSTAWLGYVALSGVMIMN